MIKRYFYKIFCKAKNYRNNKEALIFNSINVTVKRIGGGYGAKISRNAQIACACAIVSHKLNRPARFVMSIESNMQSVGKRVSTRQEYEVGVDDEGIIQYLDTKLWHNNGCSFNDPHAWATAHHFAKYVYENYSSAAIISATFHDYNIIIKISKQIFIIF